MEELRVVPQDDGGGLAIGHGVAGHSEAGAGGRLVGPVAVEQVLDVVILIAGDGPGIEGVAFSSGIERIDPVLKTAVCDGQVGKLKIERVDRVFLSGHDLADKGTVLQNGFMSIRSPVVGQQDRRAIGGDKINALKGKAGRSLGIIMVYLHRLSLADLDGGLDVLSRLNGDIVSGDRKGRILARLLDGHDHITVALGRVRGGDGGIKGFMGTLLSVDSHCHSSIFRTDRNERTGFRIKYFVRIGYILIGLGHILGRDLCFMFRAICAVFDFDRTSIGCCRNQNRDCVFGTFCYCNGTVGHIVGTGIHSFAEQNAYGAAFCGIHHNILCSAFIQLDGGIFQASPIFCANKSTGFCDFSVIDRFKSQMGDLTVLKFECLPCRAV